MSRILKQMHALMKADSTKTESFFSALLLKLENISKTIIDISDSLISSSGTSNKSTAISGLSSAKTITAGAATNIALDAVAVAKDNAYRASRIASKLNISVEDASAWLDTLSINGNINENIIE